MTTSTKKRGRSMFDAVQKIETEDAVARTKRRATSVQMKAASRAALSQQAIYGKLIELRKWLVGKELPDKPFTEN